MKGKLFGLLIVLMLCGIYSIAQEKVPNGTDGLQLDVPSDSATYKKPALQVDAPFSTFRIGFGFIYDAATYKANDVFHQQMDSLGSELKANAKVRDFRLLASGVFRSKRPISWKFAFMYDGALDAWLVRESGFTIAVPEIFSHVFIGRTKEGFSLIKVMNGHSPWMNERPASIDPIPILADGIKVFGFEPKTKIFWNVGAFNDVLSEGQGFSTFAWQYVARVGFLPIYDKESGTILHIGTNLRYGKPVNGTFSIKSRPESSPAPFIITSGSFLADRSSHVGYEVYFAKNRFLVGSEGVVHKFYSSEGGDHRFYGGNVLLSYFLTRTARVYRTEGNIFGFTTVRKSIFQGGWGEFEAVFNASMFNVNDGSVKGGELWRFTPMVNWYMAKFMRLEFIYGYVIFDRYNLRGNAQVFETRIQFTVM
jgi:phosphate-selective porin OprO/OprP